MKNLFEYYEELIVNGCCQFFKDDLCYFDWPYPTPCGEDCPFLNE